MKTYLMILTLAAGLAATGCKSGGAKAGEPSRKPRAGCQWVESGEATLGVKFLVEECGGKRPAVARKANTIEIGTGGGRIEVYGKHFAQPAITVIKEQFMSRLAKQEYAGCIVTAKPEGVKLGEGMAAYGIVPGPDYTAAAKARRDADPTAFVCGDHGQGPVKGFFAGDQKNAGGRLLYVFAGGAESGFDEMSVRLETDKAMAAKLESLTPEDLPTAELLAFTLEADMKQYKETKGQYAEGEKEASFTVFSKGGQPVVIVEQYKVRDRIDGSNRWYYMGGRLFLARQNELQTPNGGNASSQFVVWTRLAFGEGGKLIEGRKVFDGLAAEVEAGTAEESAKNAAGILARAK